MPLEETGFLYGGLPVALGEHRPDKLLDLHIYSAEFDLRERGAGDHLRDREYRAEVPGPGQVDQRATERLLSLLA